METIFSILMFGLCSFMSGYYVGKGRARGERIESQKR